MLLSWLGYRVINDLSLLSVRNFSEATIFWRSWIQRGCHHNFLHVWYTAQPLCGEIAGKPVQTLSRSGHPYTMKQWGTIYKAKAYISFTQSWIWSRSTSVQKGAHKSGSNKRRNPNQTNDPADRHSHLVCEWDCWWWEQGGKFVHARALDVNVCRLHSLIEVWSFVASTCVFTLPPWCTTLSYIRLYESATGSPKRFWFLITNPQFEDST